MKSGFIIHFENEEQIEMLDMEQRGILLTAIMAYERGKELPEMDFGTRMCFSVIRGRLDRDAENYRKTCERNAENARKRWHAVASSGTCSHKVASSGMRDDAKNAKPKPKPKPDPKPKPKPKPDPEDIEVISPDRTLEVTADVEAIILKDGSEWRPSIDEYYELERLYPSADLHKEFAKMRGWCKGSPEKRKTKTGAMRFVTSWLARSETETKKAGIDWSAV